jgi:hypothetical protein
MGILTNEVVVLYTIGTFSDGSGFKVAILLVVEQLKRSDNIIMDKIFFILKEDF